MTESTNLLIFDKSEMTELWYTAARSKIGIVVEVQEGDVIYAKTLMYNKRQQLADPDLDIFSIVQSPLQQNQFWIIRREIADAPAVE